MGIQIDGKGQRYVEVGNIRITHIEAANRDPEKDWSGSDAFRIQSYRGPDDHSLHVGAELPLSSANTLTELISALCILYLEGSSKTAT